MICMSFIRIIDIFNKKQYKYNVMNDDCQQIAQCPYICLFATFPSVRFVRCLYTKMTSK